jgi:hypothetical protein
MVKGHIMNDSGMERWTGLVLVGDGIAGLIWPREYLRKLKIGPEPLNNVLEGFAQRPTLTRVLCVAEIAFGVWIFSLKGSLSKRIADQL